MQDWGFIQGLGKHNVLMNCKMGEIKQLISQLILFSAGNNIPVINLSGGIKLISLTKICEMAVQLFLRKQYNLKRLIF